MSLSSASLPYKTDQQDWRQVELPRSRFGSGTVAPGYQADHRHEIAHPRNHVEYGPANELGFNAGRNCRLLARLVV
jgi:hypothetical protein